MPGRLNDGSDNPPRLRPTQALWGLIDLPRGGPEWSLDEKCRRVKDAGYEAIECWPAPDTAQEIRDALDKHELRLGYGARIGDLQALREAVRRAREMDADYINCHVESPYISDDEIASLVRGLVSLSEDEGFPIFVETHRGTVTENLYRTWELIRRVPEVRFTADLSHYAVGSETTAMDAQKLAPILERVSSFHARVSNGQQIQVDVGQGDTEPARQFQEFWTIAMRHYKADARPGDILPFVSELGPPTYAIVDENGRETSDRWEQALVLRRLGEAAWAKA